MYDECGGNVYINVSTFFFFFLSNVHIQDMASEESKQRDRKLAEEALFKARGAESAQAETDMFRCGKCRGRKCTYFQMQTRSADEPMTTFVTCVNCGNHWKVHI